MYVYRCEGYVTQQVLLHTYGHCPSNRAINELVYVWRLFTSYMLHTIMIQYNVYGHFRSSSKQRCLLIWFSQTVQLQSLQFVIE